MQTLSSLPHFAAAMMSPLFEVYTVYDDLEHEFRGSLLNDIASIPENELNQFKNQYAYFSSLMSKREDIELQWKLYFLIEELEIQIGKLRKQLLLDESLVPPPFGHPDLMDTIIDKDGLVYMHELDGYGGGFCKGNEVFTLAPSTNAANSTYWLLHELYNAELTEKVKIRLDPLIHHPKEHFQQMSYRMQVYGKLLDWERIKALKFSEQTEFIPDNPDKGDILKTEIIWKPSDDEIHFTCEELPKKECLNKRGSRYFHAILRKDSGIVEHCDGAIRFYTDDQFDKRLTMHIKENETTKAGTRIKIFHVTNLSQQSLINLITSFFVWNHDILIYFNPDLKS